MNCAFLNSLLECMYFFLLPCEQAVITSLILQPKGLRMNVATSIISVATIMYRYIAVIRLIGGHCSCQYLASSLHAEPILLIDTQALKKISLLYVARMQNTLSKILTYNT